MGLAGFNWVDLAILVIVTFSLVIGYIQGILRQVIWLAAVYIAMILATQYHTLVGDWIRRFTFQTHPSRIVNSVAFLIIVTVVSFLLSWLAADAYPSEKLKIFPLVNQVGGSILAIITTIVILGLLLRIVNFAVSEPWPNIDSYRLEIINGLRTSILIPNLEMLKEPIIQVIVPWLPGNILPAILMP